MIIDRIMNIPWTFDSSAGDGALSTAGALVGAAKSSLPVMGTSVEGGASVEVGTEMSAMVRPTRY